MMLDDTRCGLDASSLHRDTSMNISLAKKFSLLSCHRDTYTNLSKNFEHLYRMFLFVI